MTSRIIFIPGIFGDEPALAPLREHLARWRPVETIEVPGLGARGAVLTDMDLSARAVSDAVMRVHPKGPVLLIGYSFGASTALQVANHLDDAGRLPLFLGILDGPFQSAELPVRTARSAIRVAVVETARRSEHARRLILAPTAPAFHGANASPVRRAILTHLRNKALDSWVPRVCRAPGVYVSSGTYGIGNRDRWAELCPKLTTVPIAGRHEDLLVGEALRRVLNALDDGIATALSCENPADSPMRAYPPPPDRQSSASNAAI